jgi:hypothetical protein
MALDPNPRGSPRRTPPGGHCTCCPFPPQVISQKEGDFFFDSLRQVSDWIKKNKPQKEGEGVSVGGVAGMVKVQGYWLPPWHLLHGLKSI